MEQQKQDWGPIHLAKCFGELAVMYATEKLLAFQTMMDDAEDVWSDYGSDE